MSTHVHYNQIILALIITLASLSCSREESIENEMETGNMEQCSSMDLTKLRVGDVFKFSHFIGVNHVSMTDHRMTFTKDTLLLTVLEEKNGTYTIEEKLSGGSNIFTSQEDYMWFNPTFNIQTTWTITDFNVRVEETNPTNSGVLVNTSPLKFLLHDDLEKIALKGWKIDHNYTNSQYSVNSFTIDGCNFAKTFAAVYSDTAVPDTYTLMTIYSKEYGILMSTATNPSGVDGRGWQRIIE